MAGASVAVLDHEVTLRMEIKDEAESQEETHDFMELPNQLKTVCFLLVFACENKLWHNRAGACFSNCQQ